MTKIIFVLVVLFGCVYGFADRRFQNANANANLDFINFETQNKRPTPQPLAGNQWNYQALNNPIGLTSSTTKAPAYNQPKPGSTSTTAKDPINNQPRDIPKPAVTVTSTTKASVQNLPKSNVGGTTGTISTKPTLTPTSNVRQLVNNYNNLATTETPKPNPQNNRNTQQGNNNFPSLPKAGTQGNVPTNSGASWASIAAGKGPTGTTKPQGTPASPVGLKPQPGFPAGNVKPQGVPGSPTGLKPLVIPPGSPTGVKPQVTPPGSPTGLKPQGIPPKSPTGVKPQPNLSTPTPAPKPGDGKTTAAPEIASDKELTDLSEALLAKDVNNPARYVTVNTQQKTSSFSKDDLAPEPLFTIDPAVWNIPTISAMKSLLDNYEQDVTVNEHITPLEKNEENAFLDAVMATSLMRHLMTFLKEKGVVTPDPKQQRDLLKQTWFNMYSRGQGKIGSSGFEHIFLSEIKNNEISGLHNWLYFHTEETARRANYLGYLKKLDFGSKGNILKLHFSLKGIDKPVDTMFVGTSPELEMALYSLCFFTRADKPCPLSLGGQQFNLRTHTFRYRSKNMIGSAFPEI